FTKENSLFLCLCILGDFMAYSKVCDAQTGPLDGEVLHRSGSLELDWDLDKEELQEAGTSDPGPDPDPEFLEPMPNSVSVSPHGRFERLQEDPNYISHFTRSAGHKGRLPVFLHRYFLAGLGIFLVGILVGWFTHTPSKPASPPLPESPDLLEELLRGIKAEKINALQNLPDDSEESRARYLYQQWVGLGLTDVHLYNYTVLLSLPGSTPNTITDRSSHQCFLPSGTPCDQRGPPDLLKEQFSYAAYSAVGSLVDVQYGSVENLRRAKDSLNLTNQIAVVKLGQAPLLYKLSLLSDFGFRGVLLYIDPCDAPPGRSFRHEAFRVTLNSGGNPSFAGSGGSLTSLLVQPISAFLAKTLLSSSSVGQEADACTPLSMEGDIYSQCLCCSSLLSDRHLLVGSRHDGNRGGGTSAITTQLIAALTEQTKQGWVPDRTTVFCSWGGTALGNIGSYEWGKDNSVVLQSSAVAYVSLNSPVRGTETLGATASPTLLQQLLSCIRGGNCPGPNVSSLQLPGDASFFANELAVPTMEFAFERTKAGSTEADSFLSEAQFSAESPETIDPLFKFHETIAKLLVCFSCCFCCLDKNARWPPLLSSASSLRDHAAFFQSEAMRPANDPKERDPSHVRMLNDVLRDLEKSFIVPQTPPGVYSCKLLVCTRILDKSCTEY
uniref:N-acetylated alpha-linked acidic dipeptidase like 2 n=1 Tax=Cyprinodon variegatus TaxID=28743 RepID=A0A3Q2FPV1_CYPVA